MKDCSLLGLVLTASLLALTSCRQIDVDKLTFACDVDGDCPPKDLCCSGTCVAEETGCVVKRDAGVDGSVADGARTDRTGSDRATTADAATADAYDAANGDAAVGDAAIADAAAGDAASDAATGDAAPGDVEVGDSAPRDVSSADALSNEDASGPYGDGGHCLTSQCFLVPPGGQTACYDNSATLACEECVDGGAPAFCGQDPLYPDNVRTFICSHGDGVSGTCPHFVRGSDEIATDTLTGLTWQRTLWATATWEHAITDCGGLSFGGFEDWRLPTPAELQSLADDSRLGPAIDQTVFPETPSGRLWTSAAHATDATKAWGLDFSYGSVEVYFRASATHFHCVRGSSPRASVVSRYTEIGSGDSVVRDAVTGLEWYGGAASVLSWQQALSSCEGLTYDLRSDWRLPSKKELLSLVDYGRTGPWTAFPSMENQVFWTSTTFAPSVSYAWTTSFVTGVVGIGNKTAPFFVRCVRGGP